MGFIVADDSKKWPNGIVPYEIDPTLPDPARVRDAIKLTQQQTGAVMFRHKTDDDTAWVRFLPTTESTCQTAVGMQAAQPHKILLPDGCGTSHVIHEICHALGMKHEQTRYDRDGHVTIHTDNIEAGKEHNFNVPADRDAYTTEDSAYDYHSLMHYSGWAFSKNLGVTIETDDKWFQLIIGLASGLSSEDIKTLREAYGKTWGEMQIINESDSDLYYYIMYGTTIVKVSDTKLGTTPDDNYANFDDDDANSMFTVGFKDASKAQLLELNWVPLATTVTIRKDGDAYSAAWDTNN